MIRFGEEINHPISQSILRAITIVLSVVSVFTIYSEHKHYESFHFTIYFEASKDFPQLL